LASVLGKEHSWLADTAGEQISVGQASKNDGLGEKHAVTFSKVVSGVALTAPVEGRVNGTVLNCDRLADVQSNPGPAKDDHFD